MYYVAIEWDGDKPPTTFYNRLHSLGIYIRDPKDHRTEEDVRKGKGSRKSVKNPLERRTRLGTDRMGIEQDAQYSDGKIKGEGSVMMQEGFLLAASPTLAREIAMQALECTDEEGNRLAKSIKYGELRSDDFFATTEDVRLHNSIEDIFGRRGRPSGTVSDWDVLCLEEADIWPLNQQRYVSHCPHCGGLRVKAFPAGKVQRYEMPADVQGESLITRWTRAAFANGEFVPVVAKGQTPPAAARVPGNGEGKVVDVILRSEALGEDKLGKLPDFTAASILDAVFITRMWFAREARVDARVKTAVKILAAGGDPTKVPVTESDTAYDLLDAAPVLGHDNCAALWRSIQ